MYTSNQGRWLSPDPIGGDISNPQSLNRYAYVLNNPTTLTDPLGLDKCPPTSVQNGVLCREEGGVVRWYPPAGALPPPNLLSGSLLDYLFLWDCPGGDCATYINDNILGLAALQGLGLSGLTFETQTPGCSQVFSLADPKTGNELPLTVTTEFGPDIIDESHPAGHGGIDFAAPNGTELILNTEGQVTFPRGYHDGFGSTLTVATRFGDFLFAHLSGNPLYLVGQLVDPKSVVAFTGETGHATGPHLHVELHTPGTALDYRGGRVNNTNVVKPCHR